MGNRVRTDFPPLLHQRPQLFFGKMQWRPASQIHIPHPTFSQKSANGKHHTGDLRFLHNRKCILRYGGKSIIKGNNNGFSRQV